MTLKLHWSPDSANLPVRIALEMFGFFYEGVRVDRASGEHRSTAFRAKNPQGLIPVLEDGDLTLFETGAILWYLGEKRGRLGPSGPSMDDETARAAALTWMFYLSNTVHADLRIAFYPHRYVAGENEIDGLRAGVAQRLRGHFDLIEEHVYDRTIGHPTILPDIYFSTLVRWAQLYPSGAALVPSIDPWPTIQAMCQRVEAHPAAIKAFTAEHIPGERAITMPQPPNLPMSEITGGA